MDGYVGESIIVLPLERGDDVRCGILIVAVIVTVAATMTKRTASDNNNDKQQ